MSIPFREPKIRKLAASPGENLEETRPSGRRGDHDRRQFLSEIPILVLSTAYLAGGNEATASPIEPKTLENGFLFLRLENGRITSLRADATGTGHYGPETIAAGGSISGFADARLDGHTVVLETRAGDFLWDLPFDRIGYYDADAHVNYPSPFSTEGAYPLKLPFRKFVTSAGQVVFIEHFKRLPLGAYRLDLNVSGGSQILFCSDDLQNYDLKVTWPGQSSVSYFIADDKLTFRTQTTGSNVTIEMLPHLQEEVPSDALIQPRITIQPDFLITYEPTGKSLPASSLMTDLIRMGIYWSPAVHATGEWGMCAAETHRLNDPRSWHLQKVRSEILRYMGFIGYDRFEHFGYIFPWSRYPDYAAGAILNFPPSNAPHDMRMLHLNGQWIQTIASYVLATRDTSVLHARRARWVATDGREPQPICGKDSSVQDYVLADGDVRVDGRPSKKIHKLGQIFTTKEPFRQVMLRLGTAGKEPAKGVVALRSSPEGETLGQTEFTLETGKQDQTVTLSLKERQAPGKYFVEVSDDDSGKRYFGPGIFWWTDPETNYAGGEATSGPFHGDISARLNLLFDYMQNYMGAAKENLTYYINDPEYNVPNFKSGRAGVSTENSYWEGAGGGYDAFEGIWYNAACNSMAELSDLENNTESASRYRHLAELANAAYNTKYWHTVNENGMQFSRFLGCEDWDGGIHDYGFAYYNLEASARNIPSRDQVRSILWWLDRGYWSPDGGPILNFITTWKKHIYSIWEIAPPFNTVGNTTWLNLTGVLPFMEVLTNGGTRLDLTARELVVRSKHISIDNMHERNKRVLARYASPDRLTGGRTFPDPGGRGRWHFGKPLVDRSDIEGFREIFPQNGVLPAAEPMAYLGMEYAGKGLWLRPRVPSEMEKLKFEGIGYAGAVFDFEFEAERQEVPISALEPTGPLSRSFIGNSQFNKVGVLATVQPFEVRHDTQMSLTLERQSNEGWEHIETTWNSHVQDKQWVWLTTESWLKPGTRYRLRIHDLDAPEGETLALSCSSDGGPQLRLIAEKTRLAVTSRFNPKKTKFRLQGDESNVRVSNDSDSLSVTLEPGRRVLLAADQA